MASGATEFGNWPSEVGAEQVVAGALRLSQPQIDGGFVYWLEGRAAEGGRQQLMRAPLRSRAAAQPVTPRRANVRTRVHEYGGGEYLVRGGRVAWVDFGDQRLYISSEHGFSPLSLPGPLYADFDIDPAGRWLVAVEQSDRGGPEPENRLVAFRLSPPDRPLRAREPVVVAAGHDFYSFPRFCPDASRLVFTCWDHPDMPWDRTQLCQLSWGPDGPSGAPHVLAGDRRPESIMQPAFSARDALAFISDRDGWWNLHCLAEGEVRPLCPRAAEFGGPQWVFALSTYAWIDEGQLLCVHTQAGRERLARLTLSSGRLEDLDLPYSGYAGLQVAEGHACFVGSAPTRPSVVATLDLASGRVEERVCASSIRIDPSLLSEPEPIEFSSREGRDVHALYYAPHNPGVRERPPGAPPLLVKSHGGPTAAASSALDLRIQYFVTRGFAVVDVDYSGSSGHGRAYRERLYGRWGVMDVEDCVAAAQQLVQRGLADEERLAISGGSAGGYTTLCALTFHDVFRAGASHYGIGDLETLARDTHKFESRYLERLIGPYPERRDLYRARSPVHFPERLQCPVIFFQGLEDAVVPPAQAENMVAALAARGVAHAYVPFVGEQHGFRRAESIRIALEGELYFYSQVFGFAAEARPAEVRIVGPSAARVRAAPEL